ncbi:lactadherin-like [Asterias amurensis]|uniref:lactadherin-like n=1 Tax=Asterias amurensis TaxID=7602 RepID=UPI003AB4FB56
MGTYISKNMDNLRRLSVHLLQILLCLSACYGVTDLYHRETSYQPVGHRALLGKSFMNISGISAIRCSARCLGHQRCSSFNYDSINGVCQMNNATKQVGDDLQEMQTFTYYESTATHQYSAVSDCVNSTKLCLCNTGVKLGVEHASIIPNANLNASSSLDGNPNRGNKSTPSRGRLNTISNKPGFIGAWYPIVADTNQWIQVDLVNTTYVTGVLTQGRSDDAQWVTKYKVQYQAPFNEPLLEVKDQYGETMMFVGNVDRNGIVERRFFKPILAVKVRIVPLEWKGYIALRFELLGCK